MYSQNAQKRRSRCNTTSSSEMAAEVMLQSLTNAADALLNFSRPGEHFCAIVLFVYTLIRLVVGVQPSTSGLTESSITLCMLGHTSGKLDYLRESEEVHQ